MIRTVKLTILSKKGEYEMSDKEKFETLKERAIKENEAQYGTEIREKYGDFSVDESNQKLKGMSREEWERFQALEKEILEKLSACVLDKNKYDSEEAGALVTLHKNWLSMTWPKYSVEAHKGVAAMYVADERFRQYYDREVQGCAKFLKQAVEYWAGRL